MRAKDLIGRQFGRLTVIERKGSSRLRHALWLCRCQCGNKKVIASHDLLAGKTNSCGCLHKEMARNANETHKMTHTHIYDTWRIMKARCNNPSDMHYKWYGGRGIAVCDEWQKDFMAFYNFVSVLPHFNEKGYSIDRINNNGNYEPGNIRWATAKEQANNKRKPVRGTK